MNYVNCALLVVVLVLVVMCCMNKSNEGFKNGELKKTCRVVKGVLASAPDQIDIVSWDFLADMEGDLIRGDFAKCAEKGMIGKRWAERWDYHLPEGPTDTQW